MDWGKLPCFLVCKMKVYIISSYQLRSLVQAGSPGAIPKSVLRAQGFSTLALLIVGAREVFVVGAAPCLSGC